MMLYKCRALRKIVMAGIIFLFVFNSVSTTSLTYSDKDIELNEYWGYKNLKLTNGTGFFDTYQDENSTWWFVTPDGYAFYSVGNCQVDPEVPYVYSSNVLKRYGSYEAWAENVTNRYKEWGLNTLSAWSAYNLFNEVPYTHTFIFQHICREHWNRGKVIPDVFDPYFWEIVNRNISEVTEKLKDNPYLIGYWIGNEMHWESDSPGFDQNTLLEYYLSVPYERFQPGQIKAVEFLITRYKNDGIEVFNKVWDMNLKSLDQLYNTTKLGRTGWIAQHFNKRVKADIQDFTRLVAQTYFENVTNEIRKHDPSHLILGVRFHFLGTPLEVLEECGKYCDVISINYYRRRMFFYDPYPYMQSLLRGTVPLDHWMKRYYDITNKPLIASEWGSKTISFWILKDQIEINRSQDSMINYYKWYTRKCLDAPYVIGLHGWYHHDNLVDENDTPYDYTAHLNEINSKIYEIHGS